MNTEPLTIELTFTPSKYYGFRIFVAKCLVQLACWIASGKVGNVEATTSKGAG